VTLSDKKVRRSRAAGAAYFIGACGVVCWSLGRVRERHAAAGTPTRAPESRTSLPAHTRVLRSLVMIRSRFGGKFKVFVEIAARTYVAAPWMPRAGRRERSGPSPVGTRGRLM
jgi:hypothetical protein